MLDFCLAQVSSRLVPGDVCVPFPNETRLLISPKMKGAAHFISPGLCEFEEMAFVMHYLRPEDLFVDVGANVGAYMLLASAVAGARTIAIEPSPSTFQYLERNVRLNNLGTRVSTLHAALGRKEGRLMLTEGLGTENYVCANSNATGAVEVNVMSLDMAVSGLNPALIKMDVEGFETEVVAGAPETLRRTSLEALIIERAGNAARYGYDEAALHRQIQAQAFIPCAYRVRERSLARLSPDETGNIIYVRDIAAVEARLRAAKAFVFGSVTV
jgi:FkbM family methyltransferase